MYCKSPNPPTLLVTESLNCKTRLRIIYSRTMSATFTTNSGSVLRHQNLQPDRSVFCARRKRQMYCSWMSPHSRDSSGKRGVDLSRSPNRFGRSRQGNAGAAAVGYHAPSRPRGSHGRATGNTLRLSSPRPCSFPCVRLGSNCRATFAICCEPSPRLGDQTP